MAADRYAEIIVDIPAKKLDRVFHYGIPPALQEDLAPGMKVAVPFGERTAEGYVTGFCDTPDVAEIKYITSIIKEEPGLNPDLLALAKWMAERYMCTVLDSVRAIVPAGARMTGQRIVAPAADQAPEITESRLRDLNTREIDIYEYIITQGKVLYSDICSRFGRRKAGPVLKKLTGLGIIEVTKELKSKVRPRRVQMLELSPDLAENARELQRLVSELDTRAPKQAAILKKIIGSGALTVAQLAAAAGTTPATVREMVKKGYLLTEQAEIRRDPYASRTFCRTVPLKPTGEQAAALQKITASLDRTRPETFLLHGVTGSGKTEVYLQAISHVLEKGKQAIVLVPEISLTPQMVERFKGRFGDLVAVIHSGLALGERYDEWRRIREGRVGVVIGARSAVFAPFERLGLIIVDEEHENSYKQEDNPKYHAREVAVARARLCGGTVILGSATPSLESYARAEAGKYTLLTLDKRVAGRLLPEVRVVDLREEMHANHRGIFSRQLIEKMKEVLERGEQVILFLNRRGYSTFVVCRECGLVLRCPKCSISLTLHLGEQELRCHYCDYRRKSPEHCPKCGSESIRKFGVGTQRVEEEVVKWFPGARVARMDMDTTTGKGSHEKILTMFKRGEIDVLVGTQMIAKGLDFPGVTLVGVVTADTSLNLPDFRSAERTFQLLTQVAGRAGRGDIPGEVTVQTYNPEHFSVTKASRHDYLGFYREEMRTREALDYPPYCSLVRIVIHGWEENSVIRGAEILAVALRQAVNTHSLGVTEPVLGPAPAPVSRLRNRYRWQVCVKGRPGRLVRQIIRQVLKNLDGDSVFTALGMSIEADPMGMM
ncbi:MAG: primosomal protein N' [Firmicutes bacterium HGW-Firmicutes-14]|nr:MAG: primosomal protein N' [Firmicutes bacterium HGW-Firmicutes-14]